MATGHWPGPKSGTASGKGASDAIRCKRNNQTTTKSGRYHTRKLIQKIVHAKHNAVPHGRPIESPEQSFRFTPPTKQLRHSQEPAVQDLHDQGIVASASERVPQGGQLVGNAAQRLNPRIKTTETHISTHPSPLRTHRQKHSQVRTSAFWTLCRT